MIDRRNYRIGVGVTLGVAISGFALVGARMLQRVPEPVIQTARVSHDSTAHAIMSGVASVASKGREAEDAGDLKTAEARFKEALAVGGKSNPFATEAERKLNWKSGLYDMAKVTVVVDLAKLYKREGRSKEAYDLLVELFKGYANISDSDRTEPTLVTMYGELCLEQGAVADARSAFSTAIKFGGHQLPVFQFYPSSTAPLGELRAAAHYAASSCFLGSGRFKEGLTEATQAVSLEPRNPILLHALAIALLCDHQYARAKQENFLAESLAEGDMRSEIHRDRAASGQIDSHTSVVSVGSEWKVTHTEVVPGRIGP
jgi:tetratricopeptide (TPR) repeat protein